MTVPGVFDDLTADLYGRLVELMEGPIETPADLCYICLAYAALCWIRRES